MTHPWRKLMAATSVAATLLLGGCGLPEQGEAQGSGGPADTHEDNDIVSMVNALTAQQIDHAAQKGVKWVIADTSSWVQTNNSCSACHRAPVPLMAGAISSYTGYQVNTNKTNGTGYLADFIAGKQYAGGFWAHDPNDLTLQRFSNSAYAAFGLAGYIQYENTQYLPKLQKAIDWVIPASAGYTYKFPLDGKYLQNVTSAYVPQDRGNPDEALCADWVIPTAQYAIATRTVLDIDNGLTPQQRANYSNFRLQLADSLLGQYVRSNGTWTTEALAYTALGAISDERLPSTNSTVAVLRDDILNRANAGGGWGHTAAEAPNVYSTGMALYSLCRLGVRSDQNTKVANGLSWLASQQCSASNSYCGTNTVSRDGSWNWPGHANDVPTSFAVLAMGCYGSLNAQVTLDPTSVTLAAGLSSPQTTTFNVKVKNTGYVKNTYTLVPSGDWNGGTLDISHTNPSMTLAPGAEATDTVTVTVPANMPPSVTIPVSVLVSYDTQNGPAEKTVTFNIIIPPQPTVSADATYVQILSPTAGAIIAPGTNVTLTARVYKTADNSQVKLGTLSFLSGGAAIATVLADSTGNFTFSWPVPYQTPKGIQVFTASYNGYATSNYSVNIAPSKQDSFFTIGNPPGVVCSTGADCQSGFCVDGVCCNSACGGGSPNDCQACSRFAGAQTDGTCGTVKQGITCRPSQGFCDPEETCNGTSTTCGSDVLTAGTACVVGNGSCASLTSASAGQCIAPGRGLLASYFPNTTVSGTASHNAIEPGLATSYNFDFQWGTGAPNAATPADNFSARWIGDLITRVPPADDPLKYTGRYWFYTQADKGVRVWVDGKLIIDNWSATSSTGVGSLMLEGNKRYGVMVEFFDDLGSANLTLQYQLPNRLAAPLNSAYVDEGGLTKVQLTPAVNNPTPVRIKSPLDRTAYLAPATVTVDVEAYAMGSNNVLQSVELFRNGLSLDTQTSGFSWDVSSLPEGVYTFQAKATSLAVDKNGVQHTLTQYSDHVAVRVLPSPAGTSDGLGLTADYYNGSNFNDFRFTRSDYRLILDDTGTNPLPPDILNTNAFSTRWRGTVVPAYSESYTFSVQSNHPVKVWLKGVLIIDTQANPGQTSSSPRALVAGERASIKVEYTKTSSSETLMKLMWESKSEPKSIIPGTRLYPATASSH